MRRLRHAVIAALAGVSLAAPGVRAQPSYHDLEGGRPLRVEGATVLARWAAEMQLAAGRVEVLPAGERWVLDPRFTYGPLPLTEVSLRLPIVYQGTGALPRAGFEGLAFGAQHVLTLEQGGRPAVALAAELLLPATRASAGRSAATLAALATRGVGASKIHVNAVVGTYVARTTRDAGACAPQGSGQPCGRSRATARMPSEAPATAVDEPFAVRPFRTDFLFPTLPPLGPSVRGTHRAYWLVGAAVDRALSLRSLLLAADVVAERFLGLGRPVDWTAEVGVRYQRTPRTVLDVGVGRRFAGAQRAWLATLGASHTLGLGWLEPPRR